MRDLEEVLSPLVLAVALLFLLALAGGIRCEVHIHSHPSDAGVKP